MKHRDEVLDSAIHIGGLKNVLFEIKIGMGREADKVGEDDRIVKILREGDVFSRLLARQPKLLDEKGA